MEFILALVVIHALLVIYVFRFQRTTLGLGRLFMGVDPGKYQLLLTPTWMGVLGWIISMLGWLITVLLILQGAWIWAGVFLLWKFVGVGIFDGVSPLPTYNHCYKVIEATIRKEHKKHPEQHDLYAALQENVKLAHRQYGNAEPGELTKENVARVTEG